jgi:hypothetical protein
MLWRSCSRGRRSQRRPAQRCRVTLPFARDGSAAPLPSEACPSRGRRAARRHPTTSAPWPRRRVVAPAPSRRIARASCRTTRQVTAGHTGSNWQPRQRTRPSSSSSRSGCQWVCCSGALTAGAGVFEVPRWVAAMWRLCSWICCSRRFVRVVALGCQRARRASHHTGSNWPPRRRTRPSSSRSKSACWSSGRGKAPLSRRTSELQLPRRPMI